MMKKIIYTFLLMCLAVSLWAEYKEEVYFENTDFELKVYRIEGRKPGKTMMIIGGIQGDEPGGYLSADLYVDVSLEQGNLIIVPRANLLSILQNTRIVFKDMNRRFNVSEESIYEDKVVAILKKLISESDVLLNLHDGSGFYRNEYVDGLHNPLRYGQSIIADADSFYIAEQDTSFLLGDMAREVCDRVNEKIAEEKYHFRFNDHDTMDNKSKHKEQRHSATYYALTVQHIPAFGIETSKSLPSIEMKVKHHNLVINEMMRLFDIVPEHPRIYLATPNLDFILFKVNDQKQIIHDGETLWIPKNASVEILHIESNYERGLVANIYGYGNNNDSNGRFIIDSDTKVEVKKDRFFAGKIYIRIKEEDVAKTYTPSEYMGLVVQVDGQQKVVLPGDDLHVFRGADIKIVSILPRTMDALANFVGYPNPTKNKENDLYELINTANDLLPRFSSDGGKTYEIYIEKGNQKIARHGVHLVDPQVFAVFLQHNDHKTWLRPNETLHVDCGDRVLICGASTNLDDTGNMKINFRGYVSDPAKPGDDLDAEILLNKSLLKRFSVHQQGLLYEILVTYAGHEIGKVFVEINKDSMASSQFE